MDVKESFQQRFEKALAITGIKPSELSEMTDISQATISQYRSGYSKPKQPRLMDIAKALDVNPVWLMGLDVPMHVSEDDALDEAQKRIFSKNLRRLLEESGKTQKELAEAIGESQQVVNTWAIGRSIPRMGRVQKLADFFKVEKSVLVDEWPESDIPQLPNVFPISKKRIPLLGEIACGEPIFCNEDRESYIAAGTDVRADFCLKARGDSMTGARIMDGDIVFIQRDVALVSGQIYAVEIDDEATLKRVYYDEAAQELRLLAENPKYPTMVYSGERLAHVHVLGKAIAFQSDVI